MSTENAMMLASAVLGGALGAIGGQFVSHVLTRRREIAAQRSRLVGGFLWQMQDATESLWFRVDNLSRRSGAAVMDEGYYESSTLYVMAAFLAQKRRLGVSGSYALLDASAPSAADELRKALEEVEGAMGRDAEHTNHFFHYHRLALAECALTGTGEKSALLGYTDFLLRLDEPRYATHIEAARSYVSGLAGNAEDLLRLLGASEAAGLRLADFTDLRWTGGRKDEPSATATG